MPGLSAASVNTLMNVHDTTSAMSSLVFRTLGASEVALLGTAGRLRICVPAW